jgi:hypothetical protein
MNSTFLSDQERRFAIVPQMRDYDALEEKEWLPYVMMFQRGGLATSSFSTDEYGFRYTVWRGQRLSWTDYNTAVHRRAALIGASTAFGVGASSDAFTVASLLNRGEDRIWFNFAGRSFNSTQEVLIFLLHLSRDVDTVLVFSGINNLVLAYLSRTTSPIYNSFFAQSVFERGLRSGVVSGMRGSLRLLFREIAGKLVSTDRGGKFTSDQLKYDHVITCFRRDMRLWMLLRRALGFKLYFVFQPIASWIGKDLTPEEQEVFAILDNSDGDGTWKRLSIHLPERRERYVADVREVCEEFEVPFLDLNARPAFAENRWLFVDRAHLTDEGYTLAAEEILRAFFR